MKINFIVSVAIIIGFISSLCLAESIVRVDKTLQNSHAATTWVIDTVKPPPRPQVLIPSIDIYAKYSSKIHSSKRYKSKGYKKKEDLNSSDFTVMITTGAVSNLTLGSKKSSDLLIGSIVSAESTLQPRLECRQNRNTFYLAATAALACNFVSLDLGLACTTLFFGLLPNSVYAAGAVGEAICSESELEANDLK